MVHCRTVLTISYQDINTGDIKLIYQYAYPTESDDNLIIKDVEKLRTMFNITKIVCDDCPQGNSIIQNMENRGYGQHNEKRFG